MTKSLYEMMNGGFTTVMKQHFVDYFVGKSLNTDYWATGNSAGSAGTWAMSDFGLCFTSATGSSQGEIHFNNKRQYDGRGCAMIVTQASEFDMDQRGSGFGNDPTVNDMPEHLIVRVSHAGWSSDKSTPNVVHFQIQDTSQSPTYQTLKLGQASPTGFNTYKIECKTSSEEASVNGVLSGIITSPVFAANTKLQPMVRAKHGYTPPSVARKFWVRYVEAWNT